MSPIQEFLEILVLLTSFVIGQIIHLIKKNKLDNDLSVINWLKKNKITFLITIICGFGILESLMAQMIYPTRIVGWLTLFYSGFTTGFAGSSLSHSIRRKYTNIDDT